MGLVFFTLLCCFFYDQKNISYPEKCWSSVRIIATLIIFLSQNIPAVFHLLVLGLSCRLNCFLGRYQPWLCFPLKDLRWYYSFYSEIAWLSCNLFLFPQKIVCSYHVASQTSCRLQVLDTQGRTQGKPALSQSKNSTAVFSRQKGLLSNQKAAFYLSFVIVRIFFSFLFFHLKDV